MPILAIALVVILAITTASTNETSKQSAPLEEEATVVERRAGIGFLFPLVIFIVIGSIAGIAVFILRKKKLIF